MHDPRRIDQVDLQSEMQRSYLDYAMSVIVGRALPDVRDGLKPVHRRVIYAMYDGGYRPDNAGFYKCARIVGDVMGQYHPHGDAAIYDALARLVQPWSLRYPLVAGQGNFGTPGNLGPAAPRYTEAKMAPLAMEMVRDIDEDTVDFQDNYDGKNQEPTVLPARFPNLLVNGSEGIAVGMATRIPPHNLREVADGVQWALENPEATREELLEALIERIHGPDFPTGAHILGRKGIEDAYRTGRGSITQRAVVNVEEIQGRQCLVVTELPYQVNPDNVADKIAELVRDGQVTGIADIRDETSGPHRPAPRHRPQARRRRQGGAQQPLQAHPAAGELPREHAGDRRRRAAHPRASTDSSRHWIVPPDRCHRAAHPLPPAQGRGAPRTSSRATSRPSTRSTRSSP